MLVTAGGEIEAIDAEGALFYQGAVELRGVDELLLGFLAGGDVDGGEQTEAAAAVREGNGAEFDQEGHSLFGGVGPEGAGGRSGIEGGGVVEGGAIAAGAQVGEGHGAEFAGGVAVAHGGRVVGGEDAQRTVVVEKHGHGIAAEENVAELGLEVGSRHRRTCPYFAVRGNGGLWGRLKQKQRRSRLAANRLLSHICQIRADTGAPGTIGKLFSL